MQAMLATLVNLLENLDRIVVEEARPVIKVLKDLLVKLSREDWEVWFVEIKKFLRKEECWPRTILRRLIDAGKYDDVSSHVADWNFKVPEDCVFGADPKLFLFPRDMSAQSVTREMAIYGYKPAMIWDLLDFGAKNPAVQRKSQIVGLGSVGKYYSQCIPVLGCENSKRIVRLESLSAKFDAGVYFLGVRKKASLVFDS